MPLRSIHDFELALVAPCLAMEERGLLVDDARRCQMIADLQASIVPQEASVAAAVIPLLRDGIPKEHLFREKWMCPCCRNGVGKRRACWECAGLPKKPGKAATALLAPCAKCNGDGSRESWVFNPKGAEQKKIVLYSLLKLPKKLNKDKKLSVEENALKELVPHDTSGVVVALLRLGKVHTIISILKRLAPAEDDPRAETWDHRIHTFLNPAGTETGRFSHSESWLEVSTNLGNLPKKEAAKDPMFEVRRCLVPDEGEVFCEGDLSQAEARIVAALCGDRELLAKLDDPTYDMHRESAAIALSKDLGLVTKAERNAVGKTVKHATNYGESWKAFLRTVNNDADMHGVTLIAASAKRAIRNVYERSRRLGPWWQRVEGALRGEGTLTTCFGRKRQFFGRRGSLTGDWVAQALQGFGISDPVLREAIAFEPQSTVADLLNRGLLRWWRQHDGRWGRLLLQVHDSVLLSVPVAQAAVATKLLKACLEEEITVNGIRLVIPAEVSIGREHWAAMEKVA